MSTKAKKKQASKKNMNRNSGDDEDDDKIKPTFVIRKVDGDYLVTLQKLKDTKTRKVTDFPYTDDPPYNFKVLNKTPEEMKRMKMKREQNKKYNESVLFQGAFDNICREIYKSIDKEALCKLALLKETCMCQALQSEILCKFAEALGEIPPDVCCPLTKKPSMDLAEEDWCIEFTPPCAKYDPNKKSKAGRVNKATQFEVKGSLDDDDDKKKIKSQSVSLISEIELVPVVEEVQACVKRERCDKDGKGGDGGKGGKGGTGSECGKPIPGVIYCDDDDTDKVIKKKPKKIKDDKNKKGGGGGASTGFMPKDEPRVVECPAVDPCCYVCPPCPPCQNYYNSCYCDNDCSTNAYRTD